MPTPAAPHPPAPASPSSTYRLQVWREFDLDRARELVPYLRALGISHLYSSPILQARSGSVHGYDVVDPSRVNQELGGEQALDELCAELRRHGLGLVVDTVPNHMAVSADNPWWYEVLAEGPDSPAARTFDVEWRPPREALHGRVLLPILGSPFGEALERGEIAVRIEPRGLHATYFDHVLPLALRTWPAVLTAAPQAQEELLRDDPTAGAQLLELIAELQAAPAEARPEWTQALRQRTWQLYQRPAVGRRIDAALVAINGEPGVTGSFDALERLLALQHWQLAWWRMAREEVNYRRFFDIGDLIGVRIEDPEVLEATHRLVFRLVDEGKIQGLRIDHVDGLRDPLAYLRRLQRKLPEPESQPEHADAGGRREHFWVVVEKVLGQDERLPSEWPVAGTSGYDFLSVVNGLCVDRTGSRELESVYEAFVGGGLGSFHDLVRANKLRVMEHLLAADLQRMVRTLVRLASADRHALDVTESELRQALMHVVACLPVYRTYTRSREVAPADRAVLERAFAEAAEREPSLSPRALQFLRRVLLLEPTLPTVSHTADGERDRALEVVMAFQQFTGPVTAKGMEDTVLYTWNNLVSLNDVGSEPAAAGVDVPAFHEFNRARARDWPLSMSATSTHDTKRSEDVRARIDVLSEMPERWRERVLRFGEWNARWKRMVGGEPAPGRNMEYLLYQTLLGVWPLDPADLPALPARIATYMQKAAREAKARTSWLHPDADYEAALGEFVARVLDRRWAPEFLADFEAFVAEVAPYGAVNSLAQTLLKIGSPGVPDFYQGCELWDLSLVDPDNRRPVDFGRRRELLQPILDVDERELAGVAASAFAEWQDGRVKLLVIARALAERRRREALFLHGEYVPLEVRGERARHVCAFARRLGDEWAIVVVPRLCRRLGTARPLAGVWGHDAIVLPADAPGRWRCALGGVEAPANDGELPLAAVLSVLPVALLR